MRLVNCRGVSVKPKYLKLVGVVLLALLALYAGAGFLLAPWLLHRQFPQVVGQKLERQVSVGAVRLNPFLLHLELRDLTLEGRHGRPAISVGRLFLDLGFVGLLRRTWTVDELRLEGLRAHVVLERDGSLNLLELARRLAGEDSEPDQGPTALVVNALAAPNASVVFTDLTGEKPASAVIEPMNVEATGLSTLGNEFASHELTATLPGGGAVEWRGELGMYPSLVASGEVRVRGLTARTLWPFLRDEVLLSQFEGNASVTSRYAYDSDHSLRLEGMTLDLAEVLLARPDQQHPMLAMKKIAVAGGSVDLAGRAVAMERFEFESGQAAVSLASDGGVNWAEVLAPGRTAAGTAQGSGDAPIDGTEPVARPAAQAAATLDWKFEVAKLRIHQVGMRYVDRSRERPLSLGVSDATAELRLAISAGTATRVLADGIGARLRNVVLGAPGGGDAAATLHSVQIEEGRFDLHDKFVAAQRLNVEGGQTSIVRRPQGEIALFELLGIAPDGSSSGDAGAAWRYEVGLLRVDSFQLAVADRSFEPPLALGGTLQASVKNLGSGMRASYEAALAVNGGGSIRAEGTATSAGSDVEARVEVSDVSLKPLQPLMPRLAALTVESGAVSASASVRLGGDAGALRADGTFRVVDFLVNEAWSGDRFLAWKELQADRFELDLASRRLIIGEVAVQEPGAKIVIFEQGDVNLARVVKPDEDDGDDGEAGEGSPAVLREDEARASTGEAPAGFEFQVERVRLRNGNVDFADLSLVLPFSTKVTEIDGTIVGLSSDASRRADVRASGAIQPYGSARIEGSLVPSEPQRFTDLRVEFDNVQMPPFSPYTATFAGRKVESGKLWLDLEYKVQDRVLLGQNSIRLANFTLGERVEAPNAINVPINLAVALLTDADGQIRLQVPVRGDLDNPRFSIGSAIKQAVANALKRIVSAPFRALGRLLGGAGESVATIEFAPGSAALRPEQREKLDGLSNALAERPRLQLVVTAPYDPQTDTGALRRAQARRTLAQALGRSLAPAEDPGPIAFDDSSTRRALESLVEQQAGPGAVRELRAETSGAAGTAGREFYESLFDRLAATQPLRESSTQVLATERARSIANYLRQHGVEPERVQTGRLVEVNAGADGAVAAQLGVASAGAAQRR